jgi:hypothetical protein
MLANDLSIIANTVRAKKKIAEEEKFLPQANELYDKIITECKQLADKGCTTAYYRVEIFNTINEWRMPSQVITIVTNRLKNEGFKVETVVSKKEIPNLSLTEEFKIEW